VKALMLTLALCAVACSVDRPSVDVPENGGFAMAEPEGERRLYPPCLITYVWPQGHKPGGLGLVRFAGLCVMIDHDCIEVCHSQEFTTGIAIEPFKIPWAWVMPDCAFFTDQGDPIVRPE